MAKGNLFQGMGRGKVGDVVFTRLDGEQISRVRNRHPKNPKTAKQLLQRAVMATVMQAYSAGKEIFDHSFEGYQVPAGCQRHFLSINAKKLRSIIANDLNNGVAPAQQVGRVVAPGATTPVGFEGMIVSEGSLPWTLFDLSENKRVLNYRNLSVEGLTVKDAFSQEGVVSGDIFTIITFGIDEEKVYSVNGQSDSLASQNLVKFGGARFIVKDSALGLETPLISTGAQNLFDIETFGNVTREPDADPSSGISLQGCSRAETGSLYAAYIRSRKNSDLRSTAQLFYASPDASTYGIASQYALAAWQQGTVDLGDSELILEGGDVE